MEADFREIYHVDLADMFLPEWDDNCLSVRWVVDMVEELPSDCRLNRELTQSTGMFSVQESLLATILDCLNQVHFQSSITAASMTGKEYAKLQKKAPKPLKRPGGRIEKKKRVFLTGKQLRERMEAKKLLTGGRISVKHTKACVASRINEGGGKLNCSCPSS